MSRIKTTSKEVFKLSELEGSAREKALDWLFQGQCDFIDFDYIKDDFVEGCKSIGILVDTRRGPYYGDVDSGNGGACYTASIDGKALAAAIKTGSPWKDRPELPRITLPSSVLDALLDGSIYAYGGTTGKERGYCTSYVQSNSIDVEIEDEDPTDIDTAAIRDAICELLDDLAHWLLIMLRKEYEFQTSEECLLELADANEYEFDAEGKIA